jgi:dolichol-phosphate mannosyltransferase
MALILWTGFRRAIVQYDRGEREHGNSRWTLSKKIKYFIDAFAAFSYLPLRVSSALGILFSLVGLVYALIVLAERLTGNIPVQGFAALMIVVLLTSGVQLLILGIIGEYLWRNLDATRKRPPFIVAADSGARRTES